MSHIDVSSYALKSNFASLKNEVDKLDINKLTSVPIDSAKLSNVVKNDVVKKTEYDQLVNKVNYIDTSNFVSKTKYEKDGSDFEDKINKIDKKTPDVGDLVKKTDFNSKITEAKGKIPSMSGLATSSALTAVENKIPDVSSLATTSALTAVENKIPDVTSLVTKTDFHTKLKAASDRLTKNKSKDLLFDTELKKLKTFDTDYFVGRNYFEGDDGAQNTLAFQVKSIYFGHETISIIRYSTWKSKGISNQSLYYTKSAITAKSIRPTHVVLGTDEHFFQDSSKVIANNSLENIYIVYKLSPKTIKKLLVLKNCFKKLFVWHN